MQGVQRRLLLIVVLAAMAWLGAMSDQWRHAYPFGGQKQDYYNLLVDGFLSGQLAMKVEPHPDLFSPDPAVRARAPFLLDASLYQGRYYLYFGVVPAVLLFLPYAALTGHDLPQNAAVLLLVYGGFLLQYRVFRRAQQAYFPQLAAQAEVLATLLLAFGAVTLVLLRTAGMYEIAIAGGYFFVSLTWLGLYEALHQPARPLRWLAVASGAAGLAVGSRPTLGVVLPLVAVVALRLAADRRSAGQGIRLAGATLLPAGIVGLGLMLYNQARFNDPFEFGFNHAMAALISDGFPLVRSTFVLPNLRWYYLLPPALTPHFPYVEPLEAAVRPADYYGYEAIHGQALAAWLLLLTLVGAAWHGRRRAGWPRPGSFYLGAVLAGFLVLLLTLTLFGFRADRYMTDAQGTLVLGLALLGAYLHSRPETTVGGQTWRAGWSLLAAATIAFNVLVPLGHMHLLQNSRPKSYQTLAYLGNFPAHWLSQLGAWTYGPARFTVDLQPLPEHQPRPLLATGHSREPDTWYVQRLGPSTFEFYLEHHGHGVPARGRTELDPAQPQEIEVEMGSLFPPRWHPFFKSWDKEAVEAAKMTARLSVEGEIVVDARAPFFEASPWRVALGRTPVSSARYPAAIGGLQRSSPEPDTYRQRRETSGLWRLRLEVRADLVGLGQPVLGSGVAGAGNLLLLVMLPDGQVEFQFDQWGHSHSKSPPQPVPGSHVTVDIVVGPQVVKQTPEGIDGLETVADKLLLWLDDELAWTVDVAANQDSYSLVAIGSNAQGFSTAAGSYSGQIERLPLTPEEERALLERSIRALAP